MITTQNQSDSGHAPVRHHGEDAASPFPTSRSAAIAFSSAAIAFAAYPLLRPYGPEAGMEGALDLASTAWLASHLLGIAGFVLLAVGLRSAADSPVWWDGGPGSAPRWRRRTESWAWASVALLLPYYGAEAYGLRAAAQHAVAQDSPEALAIADLFRFAPVAISLFTLGFVALAMTGARLVHGLWGARGSVRVGAVLTAATLGTYLPQFFLPPAGRIAHGMLLGLGLLLIARGARR